jgi:hypothetical protein
MDNLPLPQNRSHIYPRQNPVVNELLGGASMVLEVSCRAWLAVNDRKVPVSIPR